MAQSQCQKCEELKAIPEDVEIIELSDELFENIVGNDKSKKRDSLEQFYQYMNAFLNNGGGVAILHTKTLQQFDKFSHVIGWKLLAMLSDNSHYADNFEVSFEDKSHAIFRVKPNPTRQWSCFSFNTMLSRDMGLYDPTHSQIRQILQSCQLRGVSSPSRRNKKLQFSTGREGRKIMIEETFESAGRNVVKKYCFHEVVGIEAKSTIRFSHLNDSEEAKVDAVCQAMWEFLPRYITAFCKLTSGGSVYFGVEEDKQIAESKQWAKVENTREILNRFTVTDSSLKVWQSRHKNNTFLIARESEVKNETSSEQKTGKMLYEERLILNDSEQCMLREKIREEAHEKLLWYPEFPDRNPVDVEFHPVGQGRPQYCIVEVVIDRFSGCVFSSREGPVSYMLQNKQLKPIVSNECIRRLKRQRREY